jgi:GMP synthase-like glutamine amidotransferase
MNLLVVDNGTDCLPELLASCEPHAPRVILRDDLTDADWRSADAIILSGGAGLINQQPHPVSRRLVRESAVPILGICWGFMLIASTYGSEVHRMERREKGVSEISIQPNPLFPIDRQYRVRQDHSWAVSKVGSPLRSLSSSHNGIEMLQHQGRPLYGTQFHPEHTRDTDTTGVTSRFLALAHAEVA